MSVFDVRESVSTLKKQLKWHRFTVSLLTSVCLSHPLTAAAAAGGFAAGAGAAYQLPAPALSSKRTTRAYGRRSTVFHTALLSAQNVIAKTEQKQD